MMSEPILEPDECLFCGGQKLQWKPDKENNRTIQFCYDCEKIVRELPRGIKPYEGGWYRTPDGKRRFLMPPYPNVDYLK